jgi:tripartite-type tricarboxylate transporter receptor subunit TctC
MLARQETAKPYFGPPGIPADRLAILRNAFDATMKDPDYLAEMASNGLISEQPMGWQEMTELVARLQQTPPDVVNRLKAAFDKFRDGE